MQFFKQLLRILIFFPSITFALLKAEVFPWAFFYSSTQKIKIGRAIPILLLLFISALFATFYSFYEGIDSDSFRSLIAYLNPLLIYLFLMGCSFKEVEFFNKIIGKVLLFYVIIGILQIIGVLSFLEPVFNLLLTRGNTDAFGLGRGVSLLSSEPSRAAYEVIFVYITWLYIKSYSKKKQLLFDFLILFFLAVVIRSSLGLVTFSVYLLFKYRLKFILPMILIPLLVLPFLEDSTSRALQFVYSIAATSNPGDLYDFILNQSGFRLISLVGSYKYALLHPFGGGVGLWTTSSLVALDLTGASPSLIPYFIENGGGNFIPVRPDSFLASIALDVGLLGILFTIYLIKPLIVVLKKVNNHIFAIVGVFLFIIIFTGAVGNPIPWVCVALAYRRFSESINNINVK